MQTDTGRLMRSQVIGTAFMTTVLILICFAVLYVCGLSWRGVLIIASSAVMIGPLIFRLWNGTFDLFEPLLMADFSMLGMYVGRPLSDIYMGHFHEGTYDISATWDVALVLVLVANISLQIGYALPIGPLLVQWLPRSRPLFRPTFALWFTALLSILGFVLFALFLQSQGGVSFLLAMIGGRGGPNPNAAQGDVFATSTAYLYNGYQVLVPGSTIMFGLWLTGKRRIFLILSIITLTPYMIIVIGGGARSGIIGLLFGLPMLWYIYRGKRPNLLTIGVGGLAIAFFFSFLRDYRNIETRNSHPLSSYTGSPVETVLQLFTTDDDEMFDVIGEIIAVTPNWVPFRPFGVITDVLVRAVPRVLWTDKPIEMSEGLFATLEPNRYAAARAGTAPSIVGDLYLDSGFISVILWMFVIGVALRAVWAWLLANRNSIIVLMLYSTVPGAIVFTMRGNLAGYFGLAFFSTFPMVLFALLQRFNLRLRLH